LTPDKPRFISGLAFVPLAITATYCATKAALHSFSLSQRYLLKDTSVKVIELAPPYVQTELMGTQQASDPRAMPLQDFIDETIQELGTDAHEVLVERVDFLRNGAGPNDNDAIKAERYVYRSLSTSIGRHPWRV
jgi:uncharacterized oxidoreductase